MNSTVISRKVIGFVSEAASGITRPSNATLRTRFPLYTSSIGRHCLSQGFFSEAASGGLRPNNATLHTRFPFYTSSVRRNCLFDGFFPKLPVGIPVAATQHTQLDFPYTLPLLGEAVRPRDCFPKLLVTAELSSIYRQFSDKTEFMRSLLSGDCQHLENHPFPLP